MAALGRQARQRTAAEPGRPGSSSACRGGPGAHLTHLLLVVEKLACVCELEPTLLPLRGQRKHTGKGSGLATKAVEYTGKGSVLVS